MTGTRRSIRLPRYDYSQAGAYFITVCTHNRKCLFGDVVDGQMMANDAGGMVQAVWDDIPRHYEGIDTYVFIMMPNHIHAVIVIVGAAPCGRPDSDRGHVDGQTQGLYALNSPTHEHHCQPVSDQGQAQGPAPTGERRGATLSLADVVHRFKTMTTKRYADGVRQSGWPAFAGRLWQRNYYEHIIRNDRELDLIREYIANNPAQWEWDRENPNAPDIRRRGEKPQYVPELDWMNGL